MKILFSEIKKFVPGLKVDVNKVSDFLTMAGFMTESLEAVKYQNKKDWLLGLEVRHNRPDCLSVMGVAGEVAGKWGKKLVLPELKLAKEIKKATGIKVKDGRFVKRVVAYKIEGVKNSKTPAWLKEYLALYGMNSKSLLVDLSNYVMILTGYPSHLLDEKKLKGDLTWDVNQDFDKIITLDGTEIPLKKKNEIILRDEEKILALAGLVGGQKAEIDEKTETIIAEMAVYDAGVVRQNASELKVNTEAGNRLSKHLDPNGLDLATNWLLALILEYGGNAETKVSRFSYYPKKYCPAKIIFNPEKPKKYAGIEITAMESRKFLEALGFNLKKASGHNFWVTAPIGRMDVKQEEDLIEEVVRLKGFEKIPVDEVPKMAVTGNITPRVVVLSDKLRETLSAFGFDETLACPLVGEEENRQSSYLSKEPIRILNSVNEEYPELRLSLASGLLNQMKEWRKKNLKYLRFFEIGKVFSRKGKKYEEHESLGLLWGDQEDVFSLEEMRKTLEKVLGHLKISNFSYLPSKVAPEIANPEACFDVLAEGRLLGIIYKLLPKENHPPVYLAEVDLNQVAKMTLTTKDRSTYEFKDKLVVLDVNIELDREKQVKEVLTEIRRKIGKKYLWNLEIKDVFSLGKKIRYTLNVSYKELDDQKAKDLHAKVFALKI